MSLANNLSVCFLDFRLLEPRSHFIFSCTSSMSPSNTLLSLHYPFSLIRVCHSIPWILLAVALSPLSDSSDGKIILDLSFFALFVIVSKT